MPTLVSTGQLTIVDQNDGYTLTIIGGNRAYVYNAAGDAVTPSVSGSFGVTLQRGGTVLTPNSYSWSAAGLLVNPATTDAATFTPTVTAAYDVFVATTVSVTVTYLGQSIQQTIPVAISKTGNTGAIGPTGIIGASNYRIYIKSTNQATIPATPGATVDGAVPVTASWSVSPVSLTGVEAQFQSDGIRAAGATLGTANTTWSTPYLSYFKVASLSAITADVGNLTVADSGSISSGKTSSTDTTNAGFFLGKASTVHKFFIGDAGNTKSMLWDGTDLRLKGGLVTNSIGSTLINTAGDGLINVFTAAKIWDFQDGTLQGFTVSSGSLSNVNNELQISSTGVDPIVFTPGAINIIGRNYNKIRIRIMKTAGSSADGTIFWVTKTRAAYSGTYQASIPNFANLTATSTWTILEIDLRDLAYTTTTAQSDWENGLITQIRFDFGASAADSYIVDWIAVGTYAPVGNITKNVSGSNGLAMGTLATTGAHETHSLTVSLGPGTKNVSAIAFFGTARTVTVTTASKGVPTESTYNYGPARGTLTVAGPANAYINTSNAGYGSTMVSIENPNINEVSVQTITFTANRDGAGTGIGPIYILVLTSEK